LCEFYGSFLDVVVEWRSNEEEMTMTLGEERWTHVMQM